MASGVNWVFLKKHDQPNLVKTNSVGKKSFTSHSVFQYKIKLKSLKVLGLIILQFYLNFLNKLKRRANFYYVYFPLIFFSMIKAANFTPCKPTSRH